MKSCFSIFKPCCIFLIIYISVIVVYGFYSYDVNKKETLHNIDEKLSLVATGIKRLLKPRFIYRALHNDKRSSDENHANVTVLTDYAIKTRVSRVFTLVKKGNGIFYAASSQTPEQMKNRIDPPFFSRYDNPPEEVFKAFDKLEPTYYSEKTKWGGTRIVLLPEISMQGVHYLAGAEISTKEIDEQLSKHLWSSIIISAIFILLAVPFVFIFKKTEKEHLEDFENLKDLLEQHTMDRTTRLERKIDEFISKE